MQTGDAIPAAVIDPEKGIIATFTGLGMHAEINAPVIQLTQTDMAKLKGLTLKVGTKMVAVATYLPDEGNPAATEWKTYKSILPYAYAADMNEITKAFNGIPESKWKEFSYGLSCIGDKTKLGMYKINLPGMQA
ncbi:MAG: hypothetical protein K0S33_3950 [Bacteroidetes bacterium]|nr:hypothetical protein [Bacteroidota bacterium]